jgi:hypothetical protein
MAMLLMSMAMAATASAELHWETCMKGAAGTKYTEENCEEASGSGEWAMAEVKGTEKAVSLGTLTLKVTEVPVVGTVEVVCSVEGTGTVGPSKFSRIEKLSYDCKAVKGCEKIEEKSAVVAEDLPWHGEAFETEKEIQDNLTHGETEKEAPGWNLTCTVLGEKETDECRAKSQQRINTTLDVVRTAGVLLSLQDFLASRVSTTSTLTGRPVTTTVSGSDGTLPRVPPARNPMSLTGR